MREYAVSGRVTACAMKEAKDGLETLGLPSEGLSSREAEKSRSSYGNNRTEQRQDTVLIRLLRAFVNPFSIVLMVLAVISMVTERFLQHEASPNGVTVAIILMMLLVSGAVRFAEEMRAKRAADEGMEVFRAEIEVFRNGLWQRLSSEEMVVGDRIRLKEGDCVPADMRLIQAQECLVSEAVITGESGLKEKIFSALDKKPEKISDYTNTVFMGTTVAGGSCEGVALAVGRETVYGGFSDARKKNGFDRGANAIAWVLIKFMVLLVPVVFVASGITQGNWISAFLFALSVAVGLTPELLPMVITACLAKGSYAMGQKQTIVKNINAMQAFGSMDVLLVDKTGTLTNDALWLEYNMDVLGSESSLVLDAAYLNSFLHRGMQNHMDKAIVRVRTMPGKKEHFEQLEQTFFFLDERPFDSERRLSSVLAQRGRKRFLLVKGSVDDVAARSTSLFYKGRRYPIGDWTEVHKVVDDMMEDGMKVLAVAVKSFSGDHVNREDEQDLILLGYLAFFDAPKADAESAIRKLKALRVPVKVLTGDNAQTAQSICRRLGMDGEPVMTGAMFDALDDNDAQIAAERTTIFAELSPRQKAEILTLLKSNGHKVGFLGDGMNDLPAMMEADVGISVDTAVQAVKDTADVILLKKDLGILEEGILEGRRAFANMTKYVKITASSNLGNIFAIVAASVLLPFFPMTSIQILLLNLLYDLLCLALPWDRVDDELVEKPLEWSGRMLSKFMLFFGPLSSVFDFVTFGFLYFVLCPKICGGPWSALNAMGQARFISLFQTGWFLESMWTQVLILHLLRTGRLPFVGSRPSASVLVFTLVGTAVFTLLVMTPAGGLIGMTPLPPVYFVFLAATVLCYLLVVTGAKKCYMKRFGSLI